MLERPLVARPLLVFDISGNVARRSLLDTIVREVDVFLSVLLCDAILLSGNANKTVLVYVNPEWVKTCDSDVNS
jgi:hypothetical protein